MFESLKFNLLMYLFPQIKFKGLVHLGISEREKNWRSKSIIQIYTAIQCKTWCFHFHCILASIGYHFDTQKKTDANLGSKKALVLL